jgi:hypothetical protein
MIAFLVVLRLSISDFFSMVTNTLLDFGVTPTLHLESIYGLILKFSPDTQVHRRSQSGVQPSKCPGRYLSGNLCFRGCAGDGFLGGFEIVDQRFLLKGHEEPPNFGVLNSTPTAHFPCSTTRAKSRRSVANEATI